MATRRGNNRLSRTTDDAETRVRTMVAPTGFEPAFQPCEGHDEGCGDAELPGGYHPRLPRRLRVGKASCPDTASALRLGLGRSSEGC
jgi:hypothetical protein